MSSGRVLWTTTTSTLIDYMNAMKKYAYLLFKSEAITQISPELFD